MVENKIKSQSTIVKFLIFCSGSSEDILEKCPNSEWIKYTSIGATVLLTSVIAVLSSFFAFQMIFSVFYISAPMAILWGLIIFNLDRYIVSSFRKNGEPLKEFIQSLPRLFLAVVIALVISKPLEIEVFKSEIKQLLVESRKKSMNSLEANYLTSIQVNDQKIKELKKELNGFFSLKERYYQDYICECDGTCGTGKRGRGSECSFKQQKYEESASEYKSQKSRIDQLVGELFKKRNIQDAEFESDKKLLDANFSTGFLARLNALNGMEGFASFSITLLLILIEITPILSKLFAPEGPYDHLISMKEYEYKTDYIRAVYKQNRELYTSSFSSDGNKGTDLKAGNRTDQDEANEKYRQLKRDLERKLKKP
jgi:hypothetical protein